MSSLIDTVYQPGRQVKVASRADVVVAGFNAPLQFRFVMLQGMRIDELGMAITRGVARAHGGIGPLHHLD